MLENPWFINISCGILLPLCWYIINYFKDEECWKRKRLKFCKIAIYNMIERFNISNSNGYPLGPRLTQQNYILVLYELYFVINGNDSSKIQNQTFINDANAWYQSYAKQNMQNAIEVYSNLEIEEMLIEVNSYGKNGKSFIREICPNFVRWFYKIRNKIYDVFNINKQKNFNYGMELLYGSYKIPTDKATVQIIKMCFQ